jgi:polyribonucleotide nucleotidyltransferase
MQQDKRHQSLTLSINGRDLIFETGKIARQANGSVLLRSGETILLTTACANPLPAEDASFFPLRVDYQEKFSSTGKTLGGFIKREGRPAEREILVSRLIDRPLRPMFEEGYYNEVQILSYVYSFDGIHLPEPLAICAASAALVISDIPLIKPIAAVRVGLIDQNFIVNPTFEEQKQSRLDLILAGTEDAILMIEGYCDFLSEEQLLQAIEEGHTAIRTICQGLNDWQRIIGKPKAKTHLRLLPPELIKAVEERVSSQLDSSLHIKEKQAHDKAIDQISEELLAFFLSDTATPKYSKEEVKAAFKEVQSSHMRHMILKENRRGDGRTCREIRPISIELGLLPRTHGSALFTRGETQSLSVCTLGGESMGQRYEDLHGENALRFYLQYFFPPFSVGEVGRMGAPGRREIGHGKLAERALGMTLPKPETFPYVIRLESNITESNGSSSMASVCGGSLALMEAGVPIKRPIAGIAMGLILEGDHYAILSDILGSEDALGDMDFKVAGDATGITAFQLDIKVEGITKHIMEAALAQAREGRLHILNEMTKVCPQSKEELSSYAPCIAALEVKPSKIGIIIGPGGKQIRAITEETGVQVDIDDSGRVSLAGKNREAVERARMIIHNLVSEIEVGKIYTGKIVSILPFGCFVDIMGKEGLCHISELSDARIVNIHDHFKEGQPLEVKVLDINKERGRISLSHRALLAENLSQ